MQDQGHGRVPPRGPCGAVPGGEVETYGEGHWSAPRGGVGEDEQVQAQRHRSQRGAGQVWQRHRQDDDAVRGWSGLGSQLDGGRLSQDEKSSGELEMKEKT